MIKTNEHEPVIRPRDGDKRPCVIRIQAQIQWCEWPDGRRCQIKNDALLRLDPARRQSEAPLPPAENMEELRRKRKNSFYNDSPEDFNLFFNFISILSIIYFLDNLCYESFGSVKKFFFGN